MLTRKNKSPLAVLAIGLGLMSLNVLAQGLDDEALNADPIGTMNANPRTVQADPLDINGQYKVPSESDRLKKQTEDLARRTNDMVQTKIETKRAENEKKLANELQGMFNGQPMQDEVGSKASAPTVTAVVPEAAPSKLDANYKIIPYAGAASMTGEGEVNFQSKMNAGMRAETLVLNKRLGIGLGFNYAQTNIQDRRYMSFQFAQNQAPEFQYKNMSGEFYGKFYLLTENVFRPYVGAGVGYNSTQLSGTNNVNTYNQFGYQGNNYNNQGYNANFASGAALIGTDLLFSERIGLNIEFKYSRAFTSAFNNNNTGLNNNFQGYDSLYLQQLGQLMDNAQVMAVNMGLVVQF